MRSCGPAPLTTDDKQSQLMKTSNARRARVHLLAAIVVLAITACKTAIDPPPPDPVPTSSTFAPGVIRSRPVMSATMYGCEIVCPDPIGSARSA